MVDFERDLVENLERIRKTYARGFKESDLANITPIIPYLRNNVSPFLDERIEKISQQEETIKEELGQIRMFGGQIISRPLTCAIYIRRDTLKNNGLFAQSLKFLDQDWDKGQFFVWAKLAEEVSNSTMCIDIAENLFRREPIEEVKENFGSLPPDTERIAERYVSYNKLLIKDPSGLTLMKYQPERILAEFLNFPDTKSLTPDTQPSAYDAIYLLTKLLASSYAQKYYEKIYPLSE